MAMLTDEPTPRETVEATRRLAQEIAWNNADHECGGNDPSCCKWCDAEAGFVLARLEKVYVAREAPLRAEIARLEQEVQYWMQASDQLAGMYQAAERERDEATMAAMEKACAAACPHCGKIPVYNIPDRANNRPWSHGPDRDYCMAWAIRAAFQQEEKEEKKR